MNENEIIAYDWLKEKYPNEKEIIFRSIETPDFVINDQLYEVKALCSNNTLYFYSSQMRKITDLVKILVVGNKKVLDWFYWKDRKDTIYNIKIKESNISSIPTRIEKILIEKLQTDFPGKNINYSIRNLIKLKEKNKKLKALIDFLLKDY